MIDNLILGLSAPSLIVGITADELPEVPELGGDLLALSMMELLGSPVLICQVIPLIAFLLRRRVFKFVLEHLKIND